MQEIGARAGDPKEPEGAEAPNSHIGSLNLSIEQIEDRATATTEVLAQILEQEKASYIHHWGINE